MTSGSLAAGLLGELSRSSHPALVQYLPGGGRIELSGKVLAQWAYKSANLLYEEGIGPGAVVVLDLPVTWRALPFALGAWLQGAAVATTGAADVAVTDRPDGADADVVIAVPRGPLALAWDGDPLGPEVLDGAADVASQADLPLAPISPALDAVAYSDAGIRFSDLPEVIGVGTSGRAGITPSGVWDLLRSCVSQWRAGGSIVVVSGLTDDEAAAALAQEGAAPRA